MPSFHFRNEEGCFQKRGKTPIAKIEAQNVPKN
jgi:hypothetical protein